MTVQDVDGIYATSPRNNRGCVRETKCARREREHGREIAPTADHVEHLAFVVRGIRTDDGGLILNGGNGRCGLDGERLIAS
jgi:hypothetical protein